MSQPKVTVQNVSHRFGSATSGLLVLDDVSIALADNEFVSIVGTSGCGKSTLLNIIAGLIEPQAGDILVDGKSIDGPGRDRGVVFQTYTLFPWLTVRKNVDFALRKSKLPKTERQSLVEHYMGTVGLKGFEDSYPNQLSGGMRQRVALARALVYSPKVLLMDEPFGALDAQTRGMMQELLLRVWEEHRITVLFITHDVDEAIFMSDRVVVMTARPGKIKREVRVTLPHPRTYEVMTTTEFIDIKHTIIEAIREETLKSMAVGMS
ncbi:ABC transporter ATP-binding protein [Aggregatilinea lenta]|uniref:ABC transporter ATP-binding protein n=1 Tax=Aggregatilinea lenta TaxID=913108 RepID=UPI000E5AED26|nr:ABC transporter ATP-binding protein [Aggregatilinea lenta]